MTTLLRRLFLAGVERSGIVLPELGAEQADLASVSTSDRGALASRGAGEATEAASAYSRLCLADGQQIKLMGEGHCCQNCTGLEEVRGAICN